MSLSLNMTVKSVFRNSGIGLLGTYLPMSSVILNKDSLQVVFQSKLKSCAGNGCKKVDFSIK